MTRKMPKRMPPMPNPWDRLPSETPQAYEAFLLYRDAGRNRNVSRIAEGLGKHPNNLWKWMKRHNWKERVLAWDQLIDDEFRSGLVHERVMATRDIIELGRGLRMKAAEALNIMIENNEVLDKKDILPWAELGVKLERLGLGESTETVEITREIDNQFSEIIKDKRARKLALELDELITESEVESAKSNDGQ